MSGDIVKEAFFNVGKQGLARRKTQLHRLIARGRTMWRERQWHDA